MRTTVREDKQNQGFLSVGQYANLFAFTSGAVVIADGHFAVTDGGSVRERYRRRASSEILLSPTPLVWREGLDGYSRSTWTHLGRQSPDRTSVPPPFLRRRSLSHRNCR